MIREMVSLVPNDKPFAEPIPGPAQPCIGPAVKVSVLGGKRTGRIRALGVPAHPSPDILWPAGVVPLTCPRLPSTIH